MNVMSLTGYAVPTAEESEESGLILSRYDIGTAGAMSTASVELRWAVGEYVPVYKMRTQNNGAVPCISKSGFT